MIGFDRTGLNNTIADHHAWLMDNTKGKQAVFGALDGGDYFDHYISYCFCADDLVGADLRGAIFHPHLLSFDDGIDLTKTNLRNVDLTNFIIQNSYIGRKLIFSGINVTTINPYMIDAIENGCPRIEEVSVYKRIINYDLLKEILFLGVTSFLDLTQVRQDDIRARYTLDSLRTINHAILSSDLIDVLTNGFIISGSGKDMIYLNSNIEDVQNNFDSNDIVSLLEIVMPVHNTVFYKDNDVNKQRCVWQSSIPPSCIKVINQDLFAEKNMTSLFTDSKLIGQ